MGSYLNIRQYNMMETCVCFDDGVLVADRVQHEAWHKNLEAFLNETLVKARAAELGVQNAKVAD